MTTYRAPTEDMMFLFNELLDNKHFKEIEQYKEETTNKDKALIKQHFEIKELTENVKSLEKQKMKKDEILQSADKLLSSQDTEIKTLRRTLAEAEATQKSQKQVFDAVVDERDILGAQLIRRNDELALLYDKIRLMEGTLEKGEVQYRERVEDVRNLKLQLKGSIVFMVRLQPLPLGREPRTPPRALRMTRLRKCGKFPLPLAVIREFRPV